MNTINVNYDYCKGCGICIEFCPKKVYVPKKDGKPEVYKPELCTACMICVRKCPDFALKVEVQHER